MDPIMALLQGGDPLEEQKRMAARLRGEEQMRAMMTNANQDAQGLDILNFVAANANNKPLADSVSLLTRTRQAQNTPQKLDKGVYIPATGAYQESPGTADEREAERDNRRLLAMSHAAEMQRATEARAAAAADANQTRAMIGTMMGQAALERASHVSALADEKKAHETDKFTQQLQRDLEKAGVPSAAEAVAKAEQVIGRHPKGDIPGFGAVTNMLPNMAVTEAGVLNRQDLAPLRNITLKNRSGQAVTSGEWERFRDELGSGVGMNADALRRGIAELKRLQAQQGVSIGAGYSDDVIKAYNSRGEFQVKRAGDLTPEERRTPGLKPATKAPSAVDAALDLYAPKKP